MEKALRQQNVPQRLFCINPSVLHRTGTPEQFRKIIKSANMLLTHENLGNRVNRLANGFRKICFTDAFHFNVDIAVEQFIDLTKLPGASAKPTGCAAENGHLFHQSTPDSKNSWQTGVPESADYR
jgi:hypothetical protein